MFIVVTCFPVCDVVNFETTLSFLIKPFSYMTKTAGRKCKYLKNKKTKKVFFIIFKGLSVVRNCPRLESGLFNSYKDSSVFYCVLLSRSYDNGFSNFVINELLLPLKIFFLRGACISNKFTKTL